MDSNITPLPSVPKEIVDAVNNKTLAVFIGAGVSRLLGCSSWDELAQNLIRRCFNLNIINFKEYESIKLFKDPKKIITICYVLLAKKGLEKEFYNEIENSLKTKKDALPIYEEIIKLRGLYITTNIDSHFHKYFEQQRIKYQENEFISQRIEINTLYHIHGCLEKDKSSIIFTVPEYIKRYNKEKFRKFLETIFDRFTVLFIGYGLAEFELLDFLITKNKSSKPKELKHFILLPFYRGEDNILEYERYYYNSMGIEVIPYAKDEKGYEQLYEVLKNLNKEINQVSTYLYDTYQFIEKSANNYDKNEAIKIFQLIKNDEPQRNHFFKCLSETDNPFPWLKPLKEKGYFDPTNNPRPQEVPDNKGYFTIPYWNILGYLENVAKKNEKNPNDEITELLREIVDNIINYRDENGNRIENYKTDWVITKIIFSLPIEKITENYIEFLKIALKSEWNNSLIASEIKKTILPKLLNRGEKAKDKVLFLLENVILDYKKIKQPSFMEKNSYEYEPIMDKFWFREALRKFKQEIAELCGLEAANIALKKIETIVNEDNTQFNQVWIPTIEDHPQNSFPDRYDCQLVFFVRDMFELANPKKIINKIQELLKEEHPIFRRIAIHIINYHYDELKKLFWEREDNPLNNTNIKHELYELFKNHAKDFSKEEIQKIVDWIETKDYSIPQKIKNNKNDIEKYLAYRKKEWLYPLLNSEHPDVLEKYEKYNKIYPVKLKHPGFDVWFEMQSGFKSPIPIEKFINKPSKDMVEYLTNFKPQEDLLKVEFGVVFGEAVINYSEKLTEEMKPFLKLPRKLQYHLLWGIKEAWKQGKNINLGNVFDFICDLISPEDFWNEKFEGNNYRNWIISQIAEFIEEGTQNDNHAFEPELLTKVESILLILAKKTEPDSIEISDIINSALNSTKGKIFSAMVNFSLRYARIYNKEDENRWIKSIKEDFTKRLNRKIEPSLEFSAILGKYLPNLYWLDKKWVIDNINKIFPKKNKKHWQAAFSCFIFYSSRIHKDIYFLLREKNHYSKAITTKFENEYVIEKLSQHICVGYLENWEDLEDEESLISKLIDNKDKKQLISIIDFFWIQRNNINEKIKTKIKPLWKKIYNVLKNEPLSTDNQEIFSHFVKWLVLIDEIDDDIFEWVKLSVKYAPIGFNTTFLSEYLLKHVSKNPNKVAKIYLEMLNAKIYLDHNVVDIQKTVNIIYEKGEKELADRICNLYGAKGFYFLRDIYSMHNQEK